MYRMLSLLLTATMVSVAGVSKCANRFIYIEGNTSGRENSVLEIVLQTTPDANWEPQPKIAVQQGKFAGQVYFDSTKSEGRLKHDCSRVPKMVQVVLLEHGQQVDSIQLSIAKDFVKDGAGDYKVRYPIEFHLR